MRSERERYNSCPERLENLIHDALMNDQLSLGDLCRTVKVSRRFVERAACRMVARGELVYFETRRPRGSAVMVYTVKRTVAEARIDFYIEKGRAA